MKKFIVLVAVIFLVAQTTSAYAAADNKWTRLVEESGKVLREVQQMPD